MARRQRLPYAQIDQRRVDQPSGRTAVHEAFSLADLAGVATLSSLRSIAFAAVKRYDFTPRGGIFGCNTGIQHNRA